MLLDREEGAVSNCPAYTLVKTENAKNKMISKYYA